MDDWDGPRIGHVQAHIVCCLSQMRIDSAWGRANRFLPWKLTFRLIMSAYNNG